MIRRIGRILFDVAVWLGIGLVVLVLVVLVWRWTPFALRSDLEDLEDRVERLELILERGPVAPAIARSEA